MYTHTHTHTLNTSSLIHIHDNSMISQSCSRTDCHCQLLFIITVPITKRCDVTALRTFRVRGSARECRRIGKEAREISGSRASGRRTRDMISLCMRDRILLVKAQAQWKRGRYFVERRSRRYQKLQFRDFEWNKGAIGGSGLPVAS
jgi:hypothetical protein